MTPSRGAAASDAPDAPDALRLGRLRQLLLRDRDGDGFPDALIGPVAIATGSGPDDVDAGVGAAAEFLSALAARALTLPVETTAWRHPRPGFRIAIGDPSPSDHDEPFAETRTRTGCRLAWLDGALSVDAPDARALSDGMNAWLDALRDHATSDSGDDAGDGADDPADPPPGFASVAGVPEALAVAVRTALAHVRPSRRVVVDRSRAGTVVELDPSLPPGRWQVRRSAHRGASRLRVVAHDRTALARACRWVADAWPRLPDGTWIDALEDRLSRFVRAESRDGRLAAAVAAKRAALAAGRVPLRAQLPYPAHDASRRLGLPVANSARDGERRRWRTSIEWEGTRLERVAREVAATLAADRGTTATPVSIEAYASETAPVRRRIAAALSDAFAAAGVPTATLRVRHAFRPALHWLIDEIAPSLPTGAQALRIDVARPRAGTDRQERWLRELYPVAELLEARHPGLEVELRLGDERATPRYEATARDAEGNHVDLGALEPIVHDAPLATGGVAAATTGGLRVRGDGALLAERSVPSDADAVWAWFARDVLPEVTADLRESEEPYLHELAVVAELSEPDERLPIDHETDSTLESLHEDVYFGVLEAVDAALGAERARRTSPGRILPFLRASEGAPSRAEVTLRRWGSHRVGVVDAEGGWHPAPSSRARVGVALVGGAGSEPDEATLEVFDAAMARDAAEARARLVWARTARPDLLPANVGLAIAGADADDRAVRLPPVPPPPAAGALPPRPLHPWEVARHARAWTATRPTWRATFPRESCLGQPLPVLEGGLPAGPGVSRRRRAAWKPSVLVSARQHANEATSTQAAFAWLERLARDPELLRRVNLVVHPIENPDGARLHAALRAMAPDHMHHAARYTAFGADLQTEPRVRGEIIGESLLRRDAARRWNPVLHLNDHGYPAHAWIRAQTGFLPRGFEDWSLPVGHLTILTTHDRDAARAGALRAALRDAVATALTDDVDVTRRTRSQVRRRARYRLGQDETFSFRSGLPFWLHHRPHDDEPAADGSVGLAPRATLITEVPDETVSGEAWDACVRMHRIANEAVTRAFLAWVEAEDLPTPS